MSYLNRLFFTLFFIAGTVHAHPGHPGPSDHGNFTHFVLGLAIALPLALGLVFWMRHRKAAAARITRKNKTD